jgi:hypothetical protein
MTIAKYFVAPKESVHMYPDGREVCDCGTKQGRAEYYSRTVAMADRQGRRCAMCRRSLHVYHPSFDHEAGRGHGGAHRDDRIEVDGHWQNAALCRPCNNAKGSKRYHWEDGKYMPVCP